MKIALIGYGKMGHMIAKAAVLRGHEIVCTVDPFAPDATCVTSDNAVMLKAIKDSLAEGAIDFSHPSSVFSNMNSLIPTGLPLVVGTTGWLDKVADIRLAVESAGSSLLYSANFSVGVNIFYQMVAEAARVMASFEEYDVAVFESHHNQKADSPSGTGLEIAKRILANIPRKTKIVTNAFDRKPESNELHLASMRVGTVPGTHTIFFDSVADSIELTHTARSREGFALGAVRAVEWLTAPDSENRAKKGIFTMNDVFASL